MSDSAYDPEREQTETAPSTNKEYHLTDKDDKSQVPIVSDNQVEQVVDKDQDSDAQLGMPHFVLSYFSYGLRNFDSNVKANTIPARDDADAIDESNILDERTRGAKPRGTYTEPADNEGMPEE